MPLKSAKRGDFHVVASQERKLATTRLAEGEELGSNILQRQNHEK
jgi:hypothetical protein